MFNENKSKASLEDELERLKNDYIKVKSVLKTKNEYEKQLIENERFLSQIAIEFVELSLDINIYDFLAGKLKELFKNSFILISVYDEDSDSFHLCSISGHTKTIEELSHKLSEDIFSLRVPRSTPKDVLLTGHLNKVDNELYQILSSLLSRDICQSLEKLLNIKKIYNIGLTWEGKIYGVVNICLSESSTIENKEIVEVLVNMAAVVMQKRKVENKFFENSAKYRSYVDNAPYGIVVTDTKDNYLEVNNMVCEITGYSKEELLKMGIPGLMPLKYLEGVSNELLYSQPTEQDAIEFKFLHKDGTTRSGSIKSIKLPKNQYIGFLTDISERKKAEEELKLNRFRLENAMALANLVNWEFNKSNKTFIFNDHFYSMCGTTAEQEGGYLMSLDYYINEFVHPDDVQLVLDAITKPSINLEYRIIRRDGETRYIITNIKFVKDEGDNLISIYGTSQDITERKNAENMLKESEYKYSLLIESAEDPIAILNNKGQFIMVNTAGTQLFNHEVEDIIGKTPYELFPENKEELKQMFDKIRANGKGIQTELPIYYKNKKIWFSMSIQPFVNPEGDIDKIQVIARDITDIKETQNKLELALEEKEMLLKEIHHRVKNNLMVISSLLNIQSKYIKDEDALSIFRESQNRAKSMALIHERLYRSTDLKKIDFGDYIRTLATDLFYTYVPDPNRVKLNLKIENLMVDINVAVPLGLITNELVTNSMKHAFPGNESGEITIEFHAINDNLVLIVSDDGVGLPDDLDFRKTQSLGLQLVNSLTEQINGKIEIGKTNGTEFKIIFKNFDELMKPNNQKKSSPT